MTQIQTKEHPVVTLAKFDAKDAARHDFLMRTAPANDAELAARVRKDARAAFERWQDNCQPQYRVKTDAEMLAWGKMYSPAYAQEYREYAAELEAKAKEAAAEPVVAFDTRAVETTARLDGGNGGILYAEKNTALPDFQQLATDVALLALAKYNDGRPSEERMAGNKSVGTWVHVYANAYEEAFKLAFAAAKGQTKRVFFRCTGCKLVRTFDYYIDPEKQAPHSLYRLVNGFRVLPNQDYSCPCKTRRRVEFNFLVGTKSDKHTCNAACINAIGPDCTCGCGGLNHGVGHRAA